MILIEKLTKQHNKKIFDCGQEEINVFFKTQAKQASGNNYSQTYVLVNKNNQTQVIAFYTLSLCTLGLSHQHQLSQSYGNEMYGLMLARMGVDLEYQGKQMSLKIIIDVIIKALQVSATVGIKGVFVDPKTKALVDFYDKLGFIKIEEDNYKMWMPINEKGSSDLFMIQR